MPLQGGQLNATRYVPKDYVIVPALGTPAWNHPEKTTPDLSLADVAQLTEARYVPKDYLASSRRPERSRPGKTIRIQPSPDAPEVAS